MNIAIGADHGGFALKQSVIGALKKWGHAAIDCGARSLDPADDYADCERAVGAAIQRGVIICGSGIGASVAATKMRGIRTAVCHDTCSAHQGVEHDDMNVQCLGARVVGDELAKELVNAFVSAKFTGEERHRRRLSKVLAIKKENS